MPIRGLGTVYAFDVGRLTGFCYGRPGGVPISGSWTLYKPSEGMGRGFANLIACMQELFDAEPPGLVVWATPPTPQAIRSFGSSTATLKALYGYPAILEGVALRYDSFVKEIHEATARKHFMGKGRMGTREATKDAVLARCHLLGYFEPSIQDDNRGDACALWDWGTAYYGEDNASKKLYLFGEKFRAGANGKSTIKKRAKSGG
jgi:hypothetical protein